MKAENILIIVLFKCCYLDHILPYNYMKIILKEILLISSKNEKKVKKRKWLVKEHFVERLKTKVKQRKILINSKKKKKKI